MPNPPVPRALKIARGNPGKRPLNKREPIPIAEAGGPPDWMTSEQKERWHFVLRVSPPGLLKETDVAILITWCVAQDAHRIAAIGVAATGLLVKRDGKDVASPLFKMLMEAGNQVIRSSEQLGFTPSARTRVEVSAPIPKGNAFLRLVKK